MLVELGEINPDRVIHLAIMGTNIFQLARYGIYRSGSQQRHLGLDGSAAFFSIAIPIEHGVISISGMPGKIAQHQPQTIFLEFIDFKRRKILAHQFSCVRLGSLIHQAQHGKLVIKLEVGLFRHRLYPLG